MRVKAGSPLLLLAGMLSCQLNAAEYAVTPFANARVQADTNKRLTTGPHDTVYGTVIDAGALFTAQSETSYLSLSPKLSVSRFTDDGNNVDQDREDYFIDATGSHRLNERVTLGAFLNFANTGVIGSELEDQGLVLFESGLTSAGINTVSESFSRKTISAGPSITYAFSERDSLRLGGSYTDVTYDRKDTLLSDYIYYSVNVAWIRQLSETDQIITSIFASKQDPELNFQVLNSVGPSPQSLQHQFDQIGATVAYVHSFSETLTGNFSVGARKTKGDFPDLIDFDFFLNPQSAAILGGSIINRSDPALAVLLALDPQFLKDSSVVNRIYRQGHTDNTGLLLDLSLEKLFERTTVRASLSRASLPSGTGVTERDELSLTAIHLLSDRLSANGAFRYFSTQSESQETLSQGFNQSTDQIRLEAGLDWRMTEFWTVGGGYSFYQISPDAGNSADNHAVFVRVAYNGRKYAISR